MTIALVILLFGLMIFVHELGHFIVAKLCGVKVEQFTIGFGPAIFKKQIGETLYAIRLLPIGGAVMMKGESGEESILVGESLEVNAEDDKDSFYSASKIKRILICVAGSMMNLISGILIMLILFAPVEAVYTATITDLSDGFAFEGEDGFQVGDKITTLGGIVGRIVKVKDEELVIESSTEKSKIRIMKWAVSTGFIQGRDATHLAPGADNQRSELATLLMRLWKNIKK